MRLQSITIRGMPRLRIKKKRESIIRPNTCSVCFVYPTLTCMNIVSIGYNFRFFNADLQNSLNLFIGSQKLLVSFSFSLAMPRQIHKKIRVVSEPVSSHGVPKYKHSINRNTNTRRCVSSTEFISQFDRGSLTDENDGDERPDSLISRKRRSRIRKFFSKLSTDEDEKPCRPKLKEKVVLFRCKKATITSYSIDSNDSRIKSSQDSLLAQGEFQIYELGATRTTYFVCGQVVHPVMKGLKIFRAGPQNFVLPLYNPERYWKIDLLAANNNDIATLECVLRCVCEYKDLSVGDADETDDDDDNGSYQQDAGSGSPESGDDTSLASEDTAVELNVPDVDSNKTLEESEILNSGDSELAASEGDESSTFNENESITRNTSASIIVSSSPLNTNKSVVFQPIPLRPSSSASMDSVLSKFERIDIRNSNSLVSQRRVINHESLGILEDSGVFSWMDPKDFKHESRNINKRYSLTFKNIRPESVLITRPLMIDDLEKQNDSTKHKKLIGAEIVKNSHIVGKLKEESEISKKNTKSETNGWSRFFSW